jgi:phage terminase small subunit
MARGGYRPNSGPVKGTKYAPRGSRKPKESRGGIPEGIKADAAAENLDPLTYMLKIMNDPDAAQDRRDRMAVAAAPFVHARKGEGFGKKDEKAERAKAAGEGRFRCSAPPRLKVVGNENKP